MERNWMENRAALSEEAVFTIVWTHFVLNGGRPSNSMYRTCEDIRCPVGLFLTNEEAVEFDALYSNTVGDLVSHERFPAELLHVEELLNELQVIHDSAAPSKQFHKRFEKRMRVLAVQLVQEGRMTVTPA